MKIKKPPLSNLSPKNSYPGIWKVGLITLGLTIILSPDLWLNPTSSYQEDSFYTLSLIERLGLSTITMFLSLITICSGFYTSRGILRLTFDKSSSFKTYTLKVCQLLVSVFSGFLLFYLFVWLSPQAYYVYYLIIFDNLPLQIVIKQAPEIPYILNFLTFSEQPSLSARGQGLLGRVLLLQPFVFFVLWRMERKNSKL